MFYTIGNLIKIKAPEMETKSTPKRKWVVRLTLLLIYFTFTRNGVSSVPVSSPQSESKVYFRFSSFVEKNTEDSSEMERGSEKKDLNLHVIESDFFKPADWELLADSFYDTYACIQLYEADRFPEVAVSPEDDASPKIYLNETDFNAEVGKCLKTANVLRSMGGTINTISSLKELPTRPLEQEGEEVKRAYNVRIKPLGPGLTADYLGDLADSYLAAYDCYGQDYNQQLLNEGGVVTGEVSDGTQQRTFSCQWDKVSKVIENMAQVEDDGTEEEDELMDDQAAPLNDRFLLTIDLDDQVVMMGAHDFGDDDDDDDGFDICDCPFIDEIRIVLALIIVVTSATLGLLLLRILIRVRLNYIDTNIASAFLSKEVSKEGGKPPKQINQKMGKLEKNVKGPK